MGHGVEVPPTVGQLQYRFSLRVDGKQRHARSTAVAFRLPLSCECWSKRGAAAPRFEREACFCMTAAHSWQT